MPCKVPVVFIVFRRPDLTARVFEAIRQACPEKLFIIADGPRNSAEADLCRQTRAMTEQVDWPCEVYRNYSEQNMGCRHRISSGLDWVFDQVEEAIILEDDCLPHLSFFAYCTELLGHYRDDTRSWCISGDNFQRGQVRGDGSYYFSNYNHTWGWATWRRAWQHYDHELTAWPEFRDGHYLDGILDDPLEVQYWQGIFETLYTLGRPDTWDYIWTFTCWVNRGLTILPNVNLIENIGFGEIGTNTIGTGCWISNRAKGDIGVLKHPAFVARDKAADSYTFDHVYGGSGMKKQLCWKYRLKKRLWRLKHAVLSKRMNTGSKREIP